MHAERSGRRALRGVGRPPADADRQRRRPGPRRPGRQDRLGGDEPQRRRGPRRGRAPRRARPRTAPSRTRTSRAWRRRPSTRTSAATTRRRPRSAPRTRRASPAAAIEAAPDFGLYGYFTSGVTEIALASVDRPQRGPVDDGRASASASPRTTAPRAGRSARAGASATSIRRSPPGRPPRRPRRPAAPGARAGHVRRRARAVRGRRARPLVLVRLDGRAGLPRGAQLLLRADRRAGLRREDLDRRRRARHGRTCRRPSTSRGRRSSASS